MHVSADIPGWGELTVSDRESRGTLERSAGRNRLESAMALLREAARQKKVHPICTAYQKLHDRAAGLNGRGLPGLIRKALGPRGEKLIISAFSHHRCFMCDNGTVPCRPCEGRGKIEEDRICPQCDGLGFCKCDFCRGTGWTDRDTIPPELRTPVLHRQLLHVRSELAPLAKALARFKPSDIRDLAPERIRALAARLMREQARLTELTDTKVLDNTDEIARFAAAIANIEHVLTFLKKCLR